MRSALSLASTPCGGVKPLSVFSRRASGHDWCTSNAISSLTRPLGGHVRRRKPSVLAHL